ncbi:DUF739 family protein [Loigolactobacillus bifermentans]|uniref:DUF739 family protein n=1 Tax=Loigolactobacillus bifermentans TaxID=1607 RepID=UPI00070C1DAE|nr:DUF739 family protein [Loigolactobacillus bifermentans]QGG59102.1 DUF739 family protein [Loigolactobacillus bifermentans]
MRIPKTVYDYSKLYDAMHENRYSQKSLANAINIGRTSMNLKLNNKADFTQSEISKIVRLLGISDDEVGDIFFKPIVRKTEPNIVRSS